MKKKIIIMVLGITVVFSSIASAGTLTSKKGEWCNYKYCYCGPGSERHFEQVNRSYISGKTKGSGDIQTYSNTCHSSHHVKVGNSTTSSRSYYGRVARNTGERTVKGNVSVTEVHSYSKY